MSAYKTRLELQEVPLGSCCFQYRLGINSHLVKDNGKLIHESDIDISLAVLNDLCSLCYLNGFCTVYAGFYNKLIYLGNSIQCFFIHTGYDLGDGLQPVHLVTGIDTLR